MSLCGVGGRGRRERGSGSDGVTWRGAILTFTQCTCGDGVAGAG